MSDRLAGWSWWFLAGVAGGLAAVGQLSTWPSPDVAWNLYAGREVLNGASIGIDVLENTPPMIFWLEAPALWVGRHLGLAPWPAWVGWITVLAVAAATAVSGLVPPGLPARAERVAGPLVLAVLLLVPGGDFGQREHLTAILIVPLLIVVAQRVGGMSVPWGAAIAAGGSAALGIGIKPFFALAWLGLVGVGARHEGRRAVSHAEHLAVVAVGATYVALVAFVAPAYFRYAGEYGSLYRQFLPMRLWEMPLFAGGMVPALVALGSWVAMRRHLTGSPRALAIVLAVATAGFLVVAFLQGKGWRYHFLPSMVVGSLLIATLHVCSPPTNELVRRLYRLAGVLTVVVLLGLGLRDAAARVVRPADPALVGDPNFRALLAIASATPTGETVAVLSTNIASGFPLILVADRRWALRFPSLWPLVALYYDQVRAGQLVRYRDPEQLLPVERDFQEAIEDDLLRARPALILVPRPAPEVPGWGGARRFDYLEWVRRAPRLGDRWLAGYRRAPDVGDYLVLRRADVP